MEGNGRAYQFHVLIQDLLAETSFECSGPLYFEPTPTTQKLKNIIK